MIGNGTISRFKVDAALADGEWRWEGALPASDPSLDVFTGPRELEATLPGGGTLLIAGSRIPGEFVNWCRAGGRVQRVEAAEKAEDAQPAIGQPARISRATACGEAGLGRYRSSGPPHASLRLCAKNRFPTCSFYVPYSPMEHDSPPARPPRRETSPRVPPFYPVPVRARHDGWTPRRQADFLGYLAETGSVSAACARVGKSREAAYKLRRRPDAESFAAAWDAALGAPVRKLTVEDLEYRARHGLVRPVMRAGKYVGVRQKPDNSALLRLIARYDRLLAGGDLPGIWANEQNGPFVSTKVDGRGH